MKISLLKYFPSINDVRSLTRRDNVTFDEVVAQLDYQIRLLRSIQIEKNI